MSSSSGEDDEIVAVVRRSDSSNAIAKPVIDFSDHADFHATVGRAVLGGAAGALAAGAISIVTGIDATGALFNVAVSAAALASVAASGKQWLRAIAGGALGAAGAMLYHASAAWPLFGAALLGAAAAPVLAAGEPWRRMAVTGAVAALFGYAGFYVAGFVPGLFAGVVPDPLPAAAAGSAAGLFFGLASAPKHIARPNDPVEAAYLVALEVKDGELHEILARALSIHRAVRAELALRKEESTVIKLGQRVGELALRILRIVDQCRRIEGDIASAPAFELEQRVAALRGKAEAASDTAARETYLAAATSLEQQRRAFDALHRGRERVVARLHANVALLEKVRFSLLHLRSADAERIGGESSPLLDALEELSREIDVTSTAVGEVFGSPVEPRAELAAGDGRDLLTEGDDRSSDGAEVASKSGVSDRRQS